MSRLRYNSKAPEAFRARKAILGNRYLYTPETFCMKGASFPF